MRPEKWKARSPQEAPCQPSGPPPLMSANLRVDARDQCERFWDTRAVGTVIWGIAALRAMCLNSAYIVQAHVEF